MRRFRYQDVFFAIWGLGPYPCTFCAANVEADEMHIHHINGDHSDDRASNLAPAHRTCHRRHHDAAAPRAKPAARTDEQRARMRAAQYSERATAARLRVAEINRGTKRSDETREKQRIAALRREERKRALRDEQ